MLFDTSEKRCIPDSLVPRLVLVSSLFIPFFPGRRLAHNSPIMAPGIWRMKSRRPHPFANEWFWNLLKQWKSYVDFLQDVLGIIKYNALRLAIASVECYSSRWAIGDLGKSGDIQAILYFMHLRSVLQTISRMAARSNLSSPRLWPWRFCSSHIMFSNLFPFIQQSSKNYLSDTGDSHLYSTGTVFEANSTAAPAVRWWRLHTPLCKRCATSR